MELEDEVEELEQSEAPVAPAVNPPNAAEMAAKMREGKRVVGARGPRTARVVIVGEAPGAEEERAGQPFVGMSGKELDKMLSDAGINPAECYFTNVTVIRPPDNDIEKWVQRSNKRKVKGKNPTPAHWVEYRGWLVEPHVAEDARRLLEEIRSINPTVVIALGNTPFWALCAEGVKGKVGIWRGSSLLSDVLDDTVVVPAYHPAFILRQWQHRRITVQDLRRAKHASGRRGLSPTGWDFIIRPSFEMAAGFLDALLIRLNAGEKVKLTCDVEVSQYKCLCVGIGTSAKRAICIPFLYEYNFYWTPEQHYAIVRLLRAVLSHPNAFVINQNIGFDTQFLVNDFLIYPTIKWDTMIAQNVLFPGTTMNLAYLASMYCRQYRYWKDDGKFWKTKEIKNWDQLWFYNCEDCARTFEVQEAQEQSLASRKLVPQFNMLMYKTFRLIMKAMFRGVGVNRELKNDMLAELILVVNAAQARVNFLATRQLDIASPKQLQDFFYRELKLKPILNEEDRPTCDGDALIILAEREPLIRPIVRWINLCRSYSTAISVCKAKTDPDNRWRCSYSLGLVETYRLSSSQNPYGRGLNLMNITAGKAIKGGQE
jgi:uracil-DNA glycosylase